MDSTSDFLKNCEDSKELKEELTETDLLSTLSQLYSSEDFNIQTVCRICLSTDSDLVPIQNTKCNGHVLSDMYSSFTDVKINPADGLPLAMCEQCKSQVLTCYKFKTMCLKSEYVLRSVLSNLAKGKIDRILTPKLEADLDVKHEEQEYLDEEAVDDFGDSDNETLCIVQKISKDKRKELLKYIGEINTKENYCDTEFVTKPKKISKSKSLVCQFCSKKFKNVRALKSHTKRAHSAAALPNSCTQCKEHFDTAHDLSLHQALHGRGPAWTCKECNKEFSARSLLRRHILRHMEVKRYWCEVCGKPFAELYALRRHSRVHTGQRPEKRHACDICDKRFSDQSLLTAHMFRHTGARPCVCAECGKTFPTARLLRSHALIHSDRKPYTCRYCCKSFRHESTRNTHHRTHTGEKPYVCAVCGKTFIQNSNLTLHMRTHTGEKPYKCSTCERSFSSGSSLKSHIRSHTGEKPYSCETCGKKFARMDLSSHFCAAAGAKPHRCPICDRTFTRAARLREHTRTHTGEKPFECEMCPHKFVSKSHLLKHKKSHDKEKTPQVVVMKDVDNAQSYTLQEQYDANDKAERTDCITEERVVNIDDNSDDLTNDVITAQEVTVETNTEVPLEVSQELVLHDDSNAKSELIMVDDTQNNYQNETLCLTNGVNFITSDINYANGLNLVAVNEGGVSISASSSVVENTTVKLYHLDQSLLEIHSVGGQVTISKINTQYSILK